MPSGAAAEAEEQVSPRNGRRGGSKCSACAELPGAVRGAASTGLARPPDARALGDWAGPDPVLFSMTGPVVCATSKDSEEAVWDLRITSHESPVVIPRAGPREVRDTSRLGR